MGKYIYLPATEFSAILKSGTKEVQYIIGLVFKLSHKWLLKVKNGMKSDNNRSHVLCQQIPPSYSWFMRIENFPFTHHWLLNFKLLVHISSPSHLPDSVKEYNRLRRKVRIEYRSDDVTKKLFLHFSVLDTMYWWSMMKNIHSPNLVGIGSWGPRCGRMNTGT